MIPNFPKKNIMKQKHFKISRETLFVFQASKSGDTTTADTDPTTTMITTTVTGVFHSGKKG